MTNKKNTSLVDRIINETGQNIVTGVVASLEHNPGILAKEAIKTVPGAYSLANGFATGQGAASAKDMYGYTPGLAEYFAAGVGGLGQGLSFGALSKEDIANKIVPLSVIDRVQLYKK